MTAATLRIYRASSVPQRLQALAAVAYVLMFAAVATTGRPGLGVGQGFYVPVILAALGGTPAMGVGAGLLAALLYELALLLGGDAAAALAPERSAIHLAGYVAAGTLVGYSSTRARLILRDALSAIEDVLHVARRDLDTGALDSRGLDAALAKRLAAGAGFALLVGDLRCPRPDDARLREAVRAIRAELPESADVARVGPAQLAALTWLGGSGHAHAAAADLERALRTEGCSATFGWAAFPGDGADGLSLVRAATERLDARRIVRGEWKPTAASAGLDGSD